MTKMCIISLGILFPYFVFGSPIPDQRSRIMNEPITCTVFNYAIHHVLSQEDANAFCAHAYQHYLKDGCKEIEFDIHDKTETYKVKTVIVDGKTD